MHFLETNGFLTPWTAPDRKVVLELFVGGLFSYLFVKKIRSGNFRKKVSDQYFEFYPHIFCTISSVLVLKQVLENIFKGRVQKKKYGNFHTFTDPPPP